MTFHHSLLFQQRSWSYIRRGVAAAPAAKLSAIESLPAPLNQAVGILYQSRPMLRALFEDAFTNPQRRRENFVGRQLQEFLLPEAVQKKLSRREDQAPMEKTFALAARD